MKIKLTRLPPSKCTGVLSSPAMAPPPYISILSLMSLTPDQSHIGTRQSVNGTKKIVFSNCTKAVNSSILQKVKLTLMPEHVSRHLLKIGGSKHVCFGGKQLHLWYMIFAESSRAWTMWGSFQGIRLQQRAFPLPAEHSDWLCICRMKHGESLTSRSAKHTLVLWTWFSPACFISAAALRCW